MNTSILNQIPKQYKPEVSESLLYLTTPEFISVPLKDISIESTETVVRIKHQFFIITLWKNVTTTNVNLLTDLF
jgi:hypothetical protein